MGYLPFLAEPNEYWPGTVSSFQACARRRTATGAPFKLLPRLLDLSLGAGRFELLFDLFGFFLGRAFADRLRGAFDQGFGFRQTEAGDRRTDFLDDADLVRADFLEDDVERSLCFRRRSRRAARRRRGRRRDRGR